MDNLNDPGSREEQPRKRDSNLVDYHELSPEAIEP